MMNIIDTHCHLDFAEFSTDREAVFASARDKGVIEFIIPAVKSATWTNLITLCGQLASVHYALGLHPMFISEHRGEHLQELHDYLSKYDPIAVGEIGLDYFDRSLQVEKQRDIFQSQLQLANEFNLPVILHVRKAHEEVLACLKESPVCGGVVHAFNGSLQQAERYMKYNFKFGFGGMLTYQRSTKLRELAKQLPLDTIVLETDSPDMTVEAHRGERNSPEYLPDCLHALADVRGLSPEVVAAQTINNTYAVFKQMKK